MSGVKDPEAEKEKSIFVRKVGVTACPRVGELGWELVPGLDTDPELDLFITSRDTYDAFYNTGLLHILTELQARMI